MSQCLHRFCVLPAIMHVKVPEVKKCCFCVPLRPGIMIFGYLMIIFSSLAIGYLVMMTEFRKTSITDNERLDVILSTILFSVFGMAVLLNVLLLIADFQKDESMLRLYSFYALATIAAGLIPTFILLSRSQYGNASAGCFAIAMQCYVLILVRSEVLNLEKEELVIDNNETRSYAEEIIEVDDNVTLL